MKWSMGEQSSHNSSPSNKPGSIIINEFDDATVKAVGEAIVDAANLCQPFLPVYITSYGGSVYHLLSVVSLLRNAPMDIHTIVTGHAMSAGAMAFCFGKRRFIAPDAYLMIHDMSCTQLDKLASIESDMKHLKHLKNQLFKLAARQIGQRSNYFLDELRQRGNVDWYLYAEEAIERGIATDIGIPIYSARKPDTVIYTCTNGSETDSREVTATV